MRLCIVAVLSVRSDELETFRSYEQQAAVIMRRYGGAIERTVFVADGSALVVKEVHLVTFADPAGFARYKADPDLAALAPLKQRAVVATEILVGVDGPQY